ncbi:glycosyltransferase family 2 protein [Rhizobium leucaenae]|uniref:Cellulose synthase (UDP-forming) n=1 Tax=Rhizobium leucaenae TaxID=29450 RepID=A0A7W6ZVN1_9HYPH|nr:glycosyltransferase family 2 protein [Rhizobium leucaenae]MBB4569541.1 cellulose synthase (UDP-forming) [Rhizobium leucaenae]MBB6299500.1 cellulose synthase (UDP-forming) [Rhizobium leucaenae]
MGKIPAAIGVHATRRPSVGPADIGPATERIFEGRMRFANLIGITIWTATMTFFWLWWLRSDHVIGWPSYLLVTLVLAMITGLPAYFIIIIHDARRMPHAGGPLPAGRVAVVVTRASSESPFLVQTTLRAMLDQTGCDFDVWLAEEKPSLEMMKWCMEHGVFTSMTRESAGAGARDSMPRCKQDSLTSFHEHFGYERYDFVVHLDAGHVPEKTYLREIIRPFRDPGIGYVSAPSICDANAASNWVVRGRLFAEAGAQGLVQSGYNNGWAPLCVDTHYAVRTAALKEIGGPRREPAEGLATTLAMNAGGWRGVHALDAIAHGDGPATFTGLVMQEFDRSRSRMTTLLRYAPGYMPNLPGWLKFQFLFSELCYPLFSSSLAAVFMLPIVTLLTGHSFVDVNYPAFLLHFLPIVAAWMALAFIWRATGTFRPANGRFVSWESAAFLLLRWPWSLIGCAAAIRDRHINSGEVGVIPKGTGSEHALPLRVLAPYIVLNLASAVAMAFALDREAAEGLFFFAAITTLIYAALIGLIIARHATENTLSR